MEFVEVTFETPRTYRTVGKVHLIPWEDNELVLPVSQTTVHMDDNNMVTGVRIPRFIAEDRGLIETVEAAPSDPMTRRDWYLLGLLMAFIGQGVPTNTAIWEAEKLTGKVLGHDER